MPELVFLWTDILVFLLVALVVIFIAYARKRPHLSRPWKQIFSSRIGISTFIVLLFYIAVGLMDSIHYRPDVDDSRNKGTDMLSVLDYVLSDLRLNHEKTYSAPLATHLYARENVEGPGGVTTREFPRLKYGGAHLQDPEKDYYPDLLEKTLMGIVLGLIAWLLLTLLITAWLAISHRVAFTDQIQRIKQHRTEIPWRTAFITLLVIMVIAGILYQLSQFYHVLGTDKVGEDVLYQALKSVRTGLLIGTLTTLVMLPAAILLGIMAGYFKGWIDDVIQYTYTTLNSIPGVLLIAAAILMMQIYMSNHEADFTSVTERADLRLLFLCLILGVTSWTGLCRLLRAETFKLSELDYVQASRSFGVGNFVIIFKHILPNVVHIVLITVVLDFSGLVLAEAVLSYVNIGVDPSTNSWGNMINSARLEMAREPIVWWSLAASLVFMFTLVLAANLFSDVVRDAFDPRLRSQS
jgi:peptide/nickel transport system permease protein